MQADFHVFLALFSMHGIAGMKGQRYRGEAWTRLKSDEEFIWNDIGSTLVVRQRTCSREELHCLEKKGEPFLFSFSLCFLLRAFFFSPANLARVSRKGIPGSARAAPLPMMTSDSDCETPCTENEWIINWSWDESRNDFYFGSSFFVPLFFFFFLRDF